MTCPNKRISLALAALLLAPLACSSQGSTKTTAFLLAPTTTLAIAEYPQTDIHFASDISVATQDRVRITVSMAEKFWGVVEPLEMWVVGLSTKAAMALKEDKYYDPRTIIGRALEDSDSGTVMAVIGVK